MLTASGWKQAAEIGLNKDAVDAVDHHLIQPNVGDAIVAMAADAASAAVTSEPWKHKGVNPGSRPVIAVWAASSKEQG